MKSIRARYAAAAAGVPPTDSDVAPGLIQDASSAMAGGALAALCKVALVLAPWTQSLTYSWRPELRFYEKRFEILRHLDEGSEMWSFRASENMAEARLIDVWHQVAFQQNEASMHLLAPSSQAPKAWDALAYCVGQIEPRYPTTMALAFQFVVPLEVSFEDAVTLGNERVLAPLDADGIRPRDWAILMDLELEDRPDVIGQTEFGIVRAWEIPMRLARIAGRTNLTSPPTIPAGLWDDETFPDVALFVDATFRRNLVGVNDGLDDLKTFWESGRDRAGSLVAALKAKLSPDDRSKEVAS